VSALKMYKVEGLAHLGRSQVLHFDGGCHGLLNSSTAERKRLFHRENCIGGSGRDSRQLQKVRGCFRSRCR